MPLWLGAGIDNHRDSALHGGTDYISEFFTRLTGRGEFANLIQTRFQLARKRCGLNQPRREKLRCDLFRLPREADADWVLRGMSVCYYLRYDQAVSVEGAAFLLIDCLCDYDENA